MQLGIAVTPFIKYSCMRYTQHILFCNSTFCFHLIGYYVFNALRFGTRVVISITFQQIDSAPDAERGSERDDESLKSTDGRVKEFHIFTFFS